MYLPAGAEDSDSDDDGFYMGTVHNTNSNFGVTNGDINRKDHTQNNFPMIPAGEEFDDEDGDELDFNTVQARSMKTTPAKINKTSITNNDSQQNEISLNSMSDRSGVGRGREHLLQRGRGRGGFSRPCLLAHRKGKSSRRSNFSSNNLKEGEAKKAAALLAVEDLRVAVVRGNTAAVQKYLDNGIDVDVQLKSGWTPLMLAASLALPDMVELLANKGANVNFQKEMYTVLMAVCAVPGNKPEDQVLTCVELLVERNARVNVYDKFRMSPLMYAAREGRATVCEVLLDHDAEINKQDMRGWMSLSWAANRGHGRVVRILLEHGADPKIYSNDGQAPSDLAYSSEHHRVADMLSLAASGKQPPSEVAPQPVASSKVLVSKDSSSSMRYNDLEMFLCGLELTHLLPVFQENKMTFEEFLNLTEKELDQMGITQVGVRTKILDSIRDVHKKEWDVTSLQSKEKHILSASEVTVILANVSRHLAFVRSSVSYVQKHLNTIKEPLEFVQDVTEAEGMEMYSKEAVDTVDSLNEELNTVKTRISKIKCKVCNTSPDLITDEKPQGTQSSLRSGSLLVAGVAIVALGAFLFHKAQHMT